MALARRSGRRRGTAVVAVLAGGYELVTCPAHTAAAVPLAPAGRCGFLRAPTPAGGQLTLACAEHWLPA
ncbi:hypothetical protein SAMN05660662_3020 [Blastococcus aurantiacus]|uniref:Uncharacterized protein n=1 Tax=Blastococcus aurantiacus TaxID=1550231 RepID=A0A1G7N066_9ACTN|nr:hypothetical protein [Blastococcus aurantiacus]SDF67352.1 hypothetical protein SAMN05660662_3020 [Blastococcus aurantiacus]